MLVFEKSREIVLVVALGVSWALPVAVLGAGEEAFRFKDGQSVFIHAETIYGTSDPVVEQKLHKKFLAKGNFRVTNKSSEADFVFHVICEYQTRRVKKSYSGKDSKWWEKDWEEQRVLVFAEGFAIPKNAYDKGLSTREDHRRAARWYWLAGSERSATTTDRRSGELVKVFHKQYRDLPATTAKAAPTQDEFAFGPSQSVYFVAYESTGAEDANLEGMLAKEFARKKKFAIASSLTDASFVFLVFSEYRTVSQTSILKPWDPGPDHKALVLAEAFAITPDLFKRYAGSKTTLRESAHWQTTFGSGQAGVQTMFGFPPKRRHRGLVKQFHQDVAPQIATK